MSRGSSDQSGCSVSLGASKAGESRRAQFSRKRMDRCRHPRGSGESARSLRCWGIRGAFCVRSLWPRINHGLAEFDR